MTWLKDRWKRSGATPQISVAPDAVLGHDVTILPTCRQVGARARVLDGAVLHEDVPPGAIVAGDPARILGYVDDPT